MNKNILLTSVSSKVPFIEALKEQKNLFDKSIKIIGIDINENIVAKYFLDEFFILPKISQIKIEEFIEFCLEKKIRYIIPTRDEDLFFYSSFKDLLAQNKISLFSAEHKAVTLCNDKASFVKNNQVDFNIKTSLNIEDLVGVDFFVVKDRFGSGSKNIGLNLNKKEAIRFSKRLSNPLFQEYIQGEEYSIDSYVDKKNNFIASIIRRRQLVQNGEAIITFSIEDKILEEKIKDFLVKNKIQGHSISQVIKKDKEYFLIECNARFGGASTLSYKMGLKSFYWFLCEENEKKFKFRRAKRNLRQVRIQKDIYFVC